MEGEKSWTLRPNLAMNENLAYLVGLLKGDGSVIYYTYKKQYPNIKRGLISLTTKDKLIVDFSLRFLKEIGLNPNIHLDKNKCYKISATSKLFVNWYLGLNLKETFNNSSLKIAFLRGFYEAEGCYYYETGNKFPYVGIVNCNEKLIYYVFDLIQELEFKPRIYKCKRSKTAYKKGWIYMIHIRRKGEAERFVELIKSSIKNIPTNKNA